MHLNICTNAAARAYLDARLHIPHQRQCRCYPGCTQAGLSREQLHECAQRHQGGLAHTHLHGIAQHSMARHVGKRMLRQRNTGSRVCMQPQVHPLKNFNQLRGREGHRWKRAIQGVGEGMENKREMQASPVVPSLLTPGVSGQHCPAVLGSCRGYTCTPHVVQSTPPTTTTSQASIQFARSKGSKRGDR